MKLSDLQETILVQLEREPAETQEDLAKRIGTHQPSISRSIRSLMDSGLVTKRDEKYALTSTGQTLVQTRRTMGQVVGSATTQHIAEVSRQVNRQMAQLQENLASFNWLQEQLQTSLSLADEMASQIRVIHQVGSQLVQDVVGPLDLIRSLGQTKFSIPTDWMDAYEHGFQVSDAVAELIGSTSIGTSQFQQQLRDITQGLDSVGRGLAAGLTLADQVSRAFDRLDIFKDIREAIEEEKAAAAAFRAAGWPLAPSMPKTVVWRVVELHEEGKTGYVSQTIMGYYRRDNHKNLVAMADGWRDHPLFEARMHVIDDALEAHIEGKYTLSVPSLIPQIEGIMSEYVIVNGLLEKLGNVHKVYRAVIGDPVDQSFSKWAIAQTLLYQLKENIYSRSEFEDELMRPVNRRDITRHTIAHGIMPGYDRESNSLRAFLLLDAVSALTLS